MGEQVVGRIGQGVRAAQFGWLPAVGLDLLFDPSQDALLDLPPGEIEPVGECREA